MDGEVNRLAREYVQAGKLSEPIASMALTAVGHDHPPDPGTALEMLDSRVVLPSFFYLMRTPRLLDIVEALVGPEIIASSVYRLRPKVPTHKQSAVPWHQDSGYFEPYCDKALVLTIWLPLVDANEENGCLWVIPRGHLGGGVVRHVRAKATLT